MRLTLFAATLLATGLAQAATAYTVTSSADAGAGSLRQALSDAAAGDTIVFDDSVTQVLLDGQLEIGKDLTIKGPGVTLDGQLKGRVLHVAGGASVTLQGLIITRGLLAGQGVDTVVLPLPNPTEHIPSLGAGIRNDGALVLDGVQVVGNYATGGGVGGGGGSGVRVSVGGRWLYGAGGAGSGSGLVVPGEPDRRASGGIDGGAGGLNGGGDGAGGGGGGGGSQYGGGGGWAGGGGGGSLGGGGGGYGGGGAGPQSSGGGSNGSSGGTGGIYTIGGLGGLSIFGGDGGAGGPGGDAGETVSLFPGYNQHAFGAGGGGYASLDGVWVGGGGGGVGGVDSDIGGSAVAAGVYSAANATLTVKGSGCAIRANLAAGGGGSLSEPEARVLNGGQAVGGLWSDGALVITPACRTAISGNAAGGGRNFGGTGPAPSDDNLRVVFGLAVVVSGGGAVSANPEPQPANGAIASCTSDGGKNCAARYTSTDPATEITLTASAPTDLDFTVQWEGACSGALPTCTVTMDQARAVKAAFTLLYPINIDANPAAGGGASCTPNLVAEGQNTTCTATANPGYAFTAFSGDCTGSSCELTNVMAPQSVTAHFEPVVTTFSGTTMPPRGTGGEATAHFTGGGDTCRFDAASTAFIAAPVAPPAGRLLPQGMFQFQLIGCEATPVTVRIDWPQPVSALSKWGLESAGAQPSWFAPDSLGISGRTTTFTVTDGQKGDDDWEKNGTIVDPVAPTASADVAPIPTLGQWALLLLGLLAGGLGARRLLRKA